jgi:hypothetical protein
MNWKLLRPALTALVVAAGIGCGGFNGTHSISPATFFLPGIGAVQPVSTNAPVHVAVVD